MCLDTVWGDEMSRGVVRRAGDGVRPAFRVMWIAGVSAGGHQRDHRVEPGGWRSPGRGEERPRARVSRSHFWREEEPARQAGQLFQGSSKASGRERAAALDAFHGQISREP